MFKERKRKALRKQIEATNLHITKLRALLLLNKGKKYALAVIEGHIELLLAKKLGLERELESLGEKKQKNLDRFMKETVSVKEIVNKKLEKVNLDEAPKGELVDINKKIDRILDNTSHSKRNLAVMGIVSFLAGLAVMGITFLLTQNPDPNG